MSRIYRLVLDAGADLYDQVCGVLALDVAYGWRENPRPDGGVEFEIHCHQKDFLERLNSKIAQAAGLAGEISETEEQDWRESWKQFFQPIECGGKFVVLPPWLAGSFTPPAGALRIFIEPKSAFGTGQHATTFLCLATLDALFGQGRLRAGQRFLDLGAGTGILGIACCLGGMSGTGVDIDPLAIDNAVENRALNGVAGLELLTGGIDSVRGEKFDLVVANILSGPLCEMAGEIVDACAPGACLLLSGILDRQSGDVADAYMALGLPRPEIRELGEWRALLWRDVGNS